MKKQFIALGVAGVLALLGVAALISYANNADDRAFEDTKMTTVLRATADVPANTPVTELADKLEETAVPQVAVLDGALTSLADVEGLVTSASLVPGDQLTMAKFAAADDVKGPRAVPKGMQELTIPIGGARLVGGVVKAGDRVGVFISYPQGKVTANPINKLLVLKVNNGPGGEDDAGGAMVTVAAKTRTVEEIVHGMEFGKVWLTLQNDATDTDGGKTISQKDVAP